MPHLEVPSASLYYETSGHISAPAVLLIHAGIATLRMWDPIVPSLEADHFVIRADGRGFGQTSAEPADFSERADALDLLDHLGIEETTAIGSSRGGSIAIDLALDAPTRVAGVVTVGSSVSGHPSIEPTEAEVDFQRQLEAFLGDQDWHSATRLQTEVMAFGPNRSADDLDPEFVELALEVNRPNAARYAERVRPVPLDPPAFGRLRELTIPLLATVGDQDFASYLAQEELIVSSVAGAEGHVFTGTAHLPSLERPSEFVQVVRDWLTRHRL